MESGILDPPKHIITVLVIFPNYSCERISVRSYAVFTFGKM